jgi:hypothetical protein
MRGRRLAPAVPLESEKCAENLIPDNAQQGSEEKTGSDANAWGKSKSQRPVHFGLIMPETGSSNFLA